MRVRRPLVALALLAGLASAVAGEDSAPARVEQFTPQGTVKQVRQVTARFSEPMVPLGDPRATRSPFEITCPEKGSARWIDSRSWSYDFARDLPAGVRCRFRLRTDAKTLAGTALGGTREFGFSTGGPAILRSAPYQGSQAIDEQQAFVLWLDAPAVEASIASHVSFTVEGIAERVESRIVGGERRAKILDGFGRGTKKMPTVVVLEAKRRFPNGAKVSLVWGKGVTTKSGVATEKDQVLPFVVRPAFTASFHCGREQRKAPCFPVTTMSVELAGPIAWDAARRIALTGPEGARWTPEEPSAPEPFVTRVVFRPPFPENASLRVELPADLHDDAGRPLANADRFPLAVQTGEFPPLAKFAARFGVVEWKADATLPVTLRNLEPEIAVHQAKIASKPPSVTGKLAGLLDSVRGKLTRLSAEERDQILPWLHRVEVARRDRSLFGDVAGERPTKSFQLPKPAGAHPFEVVGIPFAAPGLYVVELESERLGQALLGRSRPMYVPTAALVTNLSVHFKWGSESSLAWVTALDSAKPVKGASVAVQDCSGRMLWEGQTDKQGIARISGLLPRDTLPSCPDESERDDDAYRYYDSGQSEALRSLRAGLFVTARTADDLGFVGSGWDQGIEGWRFQLTSESWQGPLAVHTVLDRSLLRAGDTVHMKHLLRSKSLGGFAPVAEADRPKKMSIRHLGSDEKFDLAVEWDAGGVAETTWKIPKEAKLGSYEVVFLREPHEWTSGEFRVEQFRVPLMRATVQPPSTPQIGPSEISVDVGVQYLNGGGAGGLPVTLRWQVRERAGPQLDEFDGFVFGNGGVKEGIERRGSELEEGDEGEAGETTGPRKAKLEKKTLALDGAGSARETLRDLPRSDELQEVLTELEYRDPNGEAQTVSATTTLWPSRWLVGVKPDSWITSRERLKAQIAVVDPEGHPVANAPVEVDLFERKLYSNRTRLVGGFYAYEHVEETRRLGRLCAGSTDAKGLLVCDAKPPAEGNLVLRAAVTDPDGKVASANQEVWVPGRSQWWFRVQDSDRIDLLPEKKRYEPGETARFQVRMPFPSATALVSVEREGVAEAWVQKLSGQEPVIEVPVKDGYAPNIFVSVMAVRGRVGGAPPTALVDLGKPAFKLGVAEIRVGWRAFELKVAVEPAKSVYHVREHALVKLRVTTADGKPPPAGSEVALAAVDEGLLELAPNPSWNLLDAMMGRRGYGIENATAQGQVVGKRHYGLKALPQGGGGGRQITREMFDTLLLWQGRVRLDETGTASVEVPLNDSLTSFKIVAVASGGVGLFGTGSASIRSTQELMLLSGIAPLVREGDEVRNEFTVRNASERKMEVAVKGAVAGVASPIAEQHIALEPGEARVVEWLISVPSGADQLEYRVNAEASGAADHLRVTQQVVPVVPVRTFQATLTRLENTLHQSVQAPADAIPGRGGVRVTAAAKLTKSLAGVREWMADYPYTCLEQRVSRAIALRDEKLWQATTAAIPSYLDADGLLKYFPTMQTGSEVLSAYVLSISRAAGWPLPDSVESRLVGGLTGFVEGRVQRNSLLPTADLSIRKIAALEALSRTDKADPKLLGSITIEPNLWPTSALLDWWSVLGRVPQIPQRDARLAEAEQILRARLNLQGTSMGFSTEAADGLWWLMASPDTNAVRLVLLLVEQNRWRDDLPRVLQGALGRQHRGTWCCTITNAWGVLAVEGFAKAFEATPVDGKTAALLEAASQSIVWQEAPEGGSLFFPWPSGRGDLEVRHEGNGTPWLTIQTLSAIPLKAPLSSGYRIRRVVKPIEQRVTGRWSRGDVVRVRLEIEAQSDMTWVVVSDPIPAGASHLGTGLRRDSQLLTQTEERKGWVWPAFEERAAEAFRAYYELVPKGRFVVEHTLRLNQSGRFQLPTTRVEALYAPEMFGEAPNEPIEVGQ